MLDSSVPVLIENTAGGENAVARRFDALAQLWEAVVRGEDERRGRLLLRHLPRARRRRGSLRRRRAGSSDRRANRPAARQRLARPGGHRRRPARQPRQGRDRRRRAPRDDPRRRAARAGRDAGRRQGDAGGPRVRPRRPGLSGLSRLHLRRKGPLLGHQAEAEQRDEGGELSQRREPGSERDRRQRQHGGERAPGLERQAEEAPEERMPDQVEGGSARQRQRPREIERVERVADRALQRGGVADDPEQEQQVRPVVGRVRGEELGPAWASSGSGRPRPPRRPRRSRPTRAPRSPSGRGSPPRASRR